MKKENVFATVFILVTAIIFCCPFGGWAGNPPGQKPWSLQLQSPMRMALTPEGNLLVSDYSASLVAIVDHKSLQVTPRWFSVSGRPVGVAYASGHVYVGNTTEECVQVYNLGGKKMYQFDGVIKQPTDIAIDVNQELVFVVDGAEKKVKVFNVGGQFMLSFPGVEGNLVNPTGIALDTTAGEVLVSDYGDLIKSVYPRVQIFDYSGNLLSTIKGKQGMSGMRFSRPQGLAVDGSGHVFMVDCYSGEIMVFDRYTGKTLKTMAGYGTNPGQLRLPLDLVINPTTKDLYITNNRSATIEVFPKGGEL